MRYLKSWSARVTAMIRRYFLAPLPVSGVSDLAIGVLVAAVVLAAVMLVVLRGF